MNDRTYSDLYSLIGSLAGVSSFTSTDDANILNFVNRRIYQAYRQSKMWSRYVVGAQARPVVNGAIPFTFSPSTLNVSVATRSGTTVTIVCTAAVDFAPGMYVTIAALSGTVNANGNYQVVGVETTTTTNDTFTYELTSGTGSETYTGTATVVADAVPDIDSFNRIWSTNPLLLNSAIEYEFYVDSDGAHVVNNYSGLEGFWVGFVKKWGGPYADTATDIPGEFFEYAAHAAYADFLRGDGQVDKAIAEENIAQQYLVVELDKAETQRNNNALYRRISTYTSRQSR